MVVEKLEVALETFRQVGGAAAGGVKQMRLYGLAHATHLKTDTDA